MLRQVVAASVRASRNPTPLIRKCNDVMNLSHHPDFPPPDFVAFLAQRSGLSEEAAQHRLEDWLGEYHAGSGQRPQSSRSVHAAPLAY